MTSCQIFACICVETDAEMVQDFDKGEPFGLLKLQSDPVFDAYTLQTASVYHWSLSMISLNMNCWKTLI